LKAERKSTTPQPEGGHGRQELLTLMTQPDNHPQKCTPESNPRR